MGSDSIDLLKEAYLYQCEVNPVSALNNQGEVIAQHVYTSRVGGQRLANKSIESDPIDCIDRTRRVYKRSVIHQK